MKRSLLLLLSLPTLSSCIENDYYVNDYRYQPPPVAQVERQSYSVNQYRYSSPTTHYHSRSRGAGIYQNNNVHGHNSNPPVAANPTVVVPNPNMHGHPSQGQAQPSSNVHGHPSQGQAQSSSNVHGHYSESQPAPRVQVENNENHFHGHD